jgi:hypothetical protein
MPQAAQNSRTRKLSVKQSNLSRPEKRAAREILLLCATANISPANKEKVSKLLAKKVDWAHLVELAEFHEMMPLVFHNLTVNGFIDQVPKPFAARLNQIYHGTLFRNVLLSTELETVLAAFTKKEVDVIVVKGTVLAEQLYGNPGLRTVADMDILVKPDSLQAADALLKELGYRSLAVVLPHPFHDVYEKKAAILFHIELHWNLDDRNLVTVPLEDIWKRARPINVQGGTTMVLSPEDALVHLSNNLSKPSGRLLRNLCDITELIRKNEETFDWDYFVKSARSWGIEAGVYYSLKRSGELLGAPVPVSVTVALKPGLGRRWALDLLINQEAFLLPIKWDQLREETSSVVRCLTMRHGRQMLAVLSKFRGRDKRAAWLRSLFWVTFVFCTALGRNTAKTISR